MRLVGFFTHLIPHQSCLKNLQYGATFNIYNLYMWQKLVGVLGGRPVEKSECLVLGEKGWIKKPAGSVVLPAGLCVCVSVLCLPVLCLHRGRQGD